MPKKFIYTVDPAFTELKIGDTVTYTYGNLENDPPHALEVTKNIDNDEQLQHITILKYCYNTDQPFEYPEVIIYRDDEGEKQEVYNTLAQRFPRATNFPLLKGLDGTWRVFVDGQYTDARFSKRHAAIAEKLDKIQFETPQNPPFEPKPRILYDMYGMEPEWKNFEKNQSRAEMSSIGHAKADSIQIVENLLVFNSTDGKSSAIYHPSLFHTKEFIEAFNRASSIARNTEQPLEIKTDVTNPKYPNGLINFSSPTVYKLTEKWIDSSSPYPIEFRGYLTKKKTANRTK